MQKAAPEISEIKVAEGIYFSDYRQTLTSPSNNCLQVAINQKFNLLLHISIKTPYFLIVHFFKRIIKPLTISKFY